MSLPYRNPEEMGVGMGLGLGDQRNNKLGPSVPPIDSKNNTQNHTTLWPDHTAWQWFSTHFPAELNMVVLETISAVATSCDIKTELGGGHTHQLVSFLWNELCANCKSWFQITQNNTELSTESGKFNDCLYRQ